MPQNQESNHTLIGYVKNLLSKGEVKKVLDILVKAYPDDNMIIQLSSRYENYKKDKFLALIAPENLDRKLHQIVYSLTEYMDVLKEKKDISSFVDLDIAEHKIEENVLSKTREINISFLDWIIQRITKLNFSVLLATLVVVFCFVVMIFSLGASFTPNIEIHKILSNIKIYIHVIISFVCIFSIYYTNMTQKASIIFSEYEGKEKFYSVYPEQIELDFKRCWILFWIGTLLLYALYFIQDLDPHISDVSLKLPDGYEYFFKNVCRNISTIGIIGCFSILHTQNNKETPYFANFTSISWFIVLSSMLCLEFVIAETFDSNTHIYFDVITLLAFSVSICLLVSVLQGKLINNDIIFPIVFYVYAAIQISSALINKAATGNDALFKTLGPFTFSIYLGAKLILFLYIKWLIETGRLRLHAIRMNMIDVFNKENS